MLTIAVYEAVVQVFVDLTSYSLSCCPVCCVLILVVTDVFVQIAVDSFIVEDFVQFVAVSSCR